MIDLFYSYLDVAWQLLCDFLFPHGSGGESYAIAPLVAAAAISAAASIANGIFGAKSASKQQKEQLAALERQRRESKAWRDRIMNEDALQRADANKLLTRMDNAERKQNLAAAGKRAVMGGTGATMAATQEANAAARADTIGNIYASETSRKDRADSQYQQEKSNLTLQASNVKANAEAAKRNAMAQAATGVVNSAASVIANSGNGASDNTANAPSKSIFDQAKLARSTNSTAKMAKSASLPNVQKQTNTTGLASAMTSRKNGIGTNGVNNKGNRAYRMTDIFNEINQNKKKDIWQE